MTGKEYLQEFHAWNLSLETMEEMCDRGFELHHERGGEPGSYPTIKVVTVINTDRELPSEAFNRATGAGFIELYKFGAADRMDIRPFLGDTII